MNDIQEYRAEIIVYFLSFRVLYALHGENQAFYDFINLLSYLRSIARSTSMQSSTIRLMGD